MHKAKRPRRSRIPPPAGPNLASRDLGRVAVLGLYGCHVASQGQHSRQPMAKPAMTSRANLLPSCHQLMSGCQAFRHSSTAPRYSYCCARLMTGVGGSPCARGWGRSGRGLCLLLCLLSAGLCLSLFIEGRDKSKSSHAQVRAN